MRQVHLHYTLGSIALAGPGGGRLDEDQEVSAKDIDSAGNLATGKTLDTTGLQEGSYRLVVRATQDGAGRSAFATMNVKVVAPLQATDLWTAFATDQQQAPWQDDLLRGLSAEAQKDDKAAVAAYHRALAMKPDAVEPKSRLDVLNAKLALSSSSQR